MTLPQTMHAMVLTRHGGLDAYAWHEDWPVPQPDAGEVLIRVGACGLNNTDVNTRSGWYSKAVSEATTGGAYEKVDDEDPTWGGVPITFPRIQGADVCGEIVAVGADVPEGRVGQRVLIDCWLRGPLDLGNPTVDDEAVGYFGSERNGGFAQFTTAPARKVIPVSSSLSDAELATFACSYTTAEGMLERVNLGPSDTVLITGASGGVGSALIQLANRRGARVIAMASESKHAALAPLAPDRLLPRAPDDLKAALAGENITVVADVVGGAEWPLLIDVLERGGRYVVSGAIAGPMVTLDLRTLYLRDLTFHGSTVLGPEIMRNLVRYIEAGEVRPMLAATYPLSDLRDAQTAFIEKRHTGNIVVVP